MLKKTGYALVIVLLGIQLIRPTKNLGDPFGANEISKHYQISEQVHATLQHSCYNCHSNKTSYPWYANIQPIGWWLQSHVNDGKKHLNFSEYGAYPEKRPSTNLKKLKMQPRTAGCLWKVTLGFTAMPS